MVKLISRAARRPAQLFLLATLTALLVGCGGGSGDTGPVDEDGDGIPDIDDPFVDVNPMDGLDDLTGETEESANALATNTLIPTDAQPCGNQPSSATDNNSSTATWDDNCFVARSIQSEAQGSFLGDSLYAVGIQRVVYCSGFGDDVSYIDFADGEYAGGSETALIAFQNAESLTADGLIGPSTWGALQRKVEVLTPGPLGGADTMGFSTGPCAGIPMFYQSTSLASDGVNIDRGGWTLAKNQPNEAQSVPFSFERPFKKL